MNVTSPTSARVVVEVVERSVPVCSALVVFARATGSAILESSRTDERYGRFSIFACDPVEVFSIDRLGSGCPFLALADRIASFPRLAAGRCDPPFAGGWIGFISYEAGLMFERIGCTTRRDRPLPALRFCLYDSAAVYDHAADRWYAMAVDWPAGVVLRPSVADRLAAVYELLAKAERLGDVRPPPSPATTSMEPNMSHGAYLNKVRRAKRCIEAGDIYQVNLTQRFTGRTDASAVALYLRLRRVSPSPHGALLRWGNMAILSSSPELFLSLRSGHVVTRPIKGTRPRYGDCVADTLSRRALVNSGKDRAELNMIVDLLRNDLGRVCSFGTVRVVSAGDVEEHPTVFHRVATIEGELEPHRGWLELLRAAFPGGSVTGAPKIRAMQIINELEPTARGVYCGAMGWIGLDGSMSLNLAIRTMLQVDDVVDVHAGGAIVADSDPEDEYNEILAKAAGMFRALGSAAPSRSRRPQRVTTH